MQPDQTQATSLISVLGMDNLSQEEKDVLFICSSPLETKKEYLLNVPLNIQRKNHLESIKWVEQVNG